MNLYEKIQAVSNAVNNIEKNLSVGIGAYSYKAVGDLDVTLSVKKAETKFKLISIPVKQELISSEVVKTLKRDNTEGLTYVDNIKLTLKIVDLEDPTQFIEVESFGKGIDSGDKGFGKASTYARKYALLNAYKIATGADPDANKSEEMKIEKTITEKRVKVENFFNADIPRLQNVLKHYNIGELSDLTEVQISEIYKTYNAKGKM